MFSSLALGKANQDLLKQREKPGLNKIRLAPFHPGISKHLLYTRQYTQPHGTSVKVGTKQQPADTSAGTHRVLQSAQVPLSPASGMLLGYPETWEVAMNSSQQGKVPICQGRTVFWAIHNTNSSEVKVGCFPWSCN